MKLSSPSLIRCVRFLVSRTQKHNSVYVCFCFKCNLARMLIHILRYRRHDCLLSIIADRKKKVLCPWFFKDAIVLSRQKVKGKKMSTIKPRYPNLKIFEENLYHFQSFDSFYFKLVSILSVIFRNGPDYCFCHKYHRSPNLSCPLCEWNYIALLEL